MADIPVSCQDQSNDSGANEPGTSFACPICQVEFSPQKSPAMPFCSHRCRFVDLNHWLNEEYGLPDLPDPLDEE